MRHVGLQELLDLGIQARDRDDQQSALKHFQEAVAAYPRNLRAKVETALALSKLSRSGEGEAQCRAILDDHPDHIPALLALGEILLGCGRPAEAEATLNRAGRLAPGNARVRQALARAAARGDTGETHTKPDTPLDAPEGTGRPDRNSVPDLMRLGRSARDSGNREAALDAFKAVLEQQPDNLHALMQCAMEERALGRPAEAGRLLELGLQVDENHTGVLMQLAAQARLADDEEAALLWCYRAMAADPKLLQPYLEASRVALALGRGKLALALLDHAEKAVGREPALLARRLELLRLTGEKMQAKSVLADLPEDAGGHSALWTQRVEFHLASGQYDAAEQVLARLAHLSRPDMSRVHAFRGQLAEMRWDFVEAAVRYREALSLQDSVSNRIALARAQLLMLDLGPARDNLDAAAALQSSQRLLRGNSLNASQTLLGQFLNKFMLDKDVLRELREAIVLPMQERLPRLRQMVRKAGDNTTSAILLLIAMRGAGCFQAPQPGAPGQQRVIPARIVQYWSEPRVPAGLAGTMQSWRDQHPDWDYQRFDDQKAREFLSSRHPSGVLSAYQHAVQPAQKAEVFRLAYLAAEGGFYAEPDDRSLASLESIVPAHARLVVFQEQYGAIAGNFLGAVPGEPMIVKALDLAVQALNRGDHDVPWFSTGPGLLTRAFAQVHADEETSEGLPGGSLVLDRAQWSEAVAVHCRVNDKRADRPRSTAVKVRSAGMSRPAGPGREAAQPVTWRNALAVATDRRRSAV
jgi:tetratricopeptide (TPR) repeat protein